MLPAAFENNYSICWLRQNYSRKKRKDAPRCATLNGTKGLCTGVGFSAHCDACDINWFFVDVRHNLMCHYRGHALAFGYNKNPRYVCFFSLPSLPVECVC